MEHEVHVPVPAERLRGALADPARVARAVPGFQQDAGTEPVAGRLKVRVGSHSITYRGSVRVCAQDDGTYAVEGDATEARGTGSVKLALTLRVRESDGGCTLVLDGTATADGRITELAPDAVRTATTRLLDRFAENLGAEAEADGELEEPGAAELTDPTAMFETLATEVPAPPTGSSADEPDEIDSDDSDDSDDVDDIDEPVAGIGGLDEPEPHVSETFADTPVPPAEAAHAPHDDRPQRGGGRPRTPARPLRPRPRPADRVGERHPPLGGPGRCGDRGLGDRGQQGVAQTPLTLRRTPS